jgi:hypothetical protein
MQKWQPWAKQAPSEMQAQLMVRPPLLPHERVKRGQVYWAM